MPLFSSAKAKVQRAVTLIDELEAILEEWIALGAIKSELTGHEPADDGGRDWITSEITFHAIPESAPLLLGDIFHNLRASLDHMASELARSNGENDKGVYFPFSESVEFLDEQIKRKNFKRCGGDAVRLLRSLKPYKGGNIELRAIHDLNVIDKHRSFIPQPRFTFREVKYGDFIGESFLKDGILTRTLRFSPPSVSGIHFIFPDDTELARRPLIETLKELVCVCESILQLFASPKLSDQGWIDRNSDILAEPDPHEIIYFRARVEPPRTKQPG